MWNFQNEILEILVVLKYRQKPSLWLEIEWGFVVRSVWRGQMSVISSKS